MSQIQNLREYILKECEERGSPSLVEVMARFDFHQHCIPTLNEVRQAIKGINNIHITKNENGIYLNIENSATDIDVQKITEKDMQATYEAYIKCK